MGPDLVFEMYEGSEFTIKFISNGYLLNYRSYNSGNYSQAAFQTWEALVIFLRTKYDQGDWR